MSDSELESRRNRKRQIRIVKDSSDDEADSSDESQAQIHPVLKRRLILEDSSSSEEESSSDDSVVNPVRKRRKNDLDDSEWETESESPEAKTAADVDSDFSDGQSEKCPICLISFTSQEIGTPESCDHVFCVECIQEWAKNMNTCPVDRKEFNIILVRKDITSKFYKQIAVQSMMGQYGESAVDDPSFCEICGLSDREDRMLLCDGCDLGFHLECLTPALQEIPIGSWYCSDCSPEDVVDPEIQLFELHLLLDDAQDMERPITHRRLQPFSSRLVPRTRQSERVLNRITANRSDRRQSATSSAPVTERSTAVTSTTRRKKRKSRPRYRTIHQMDEQTGETITIKKRIKRRKKKRRRKASPKRCGPRTQDQQRWQPGGVHRLNMFGDRDELSYFSDEGEEDPGGGETAVLRARFPTMLDARAMRRSRVKMLQIPEVTVSSSTDILGSILHSQTQLHAKGSQISLGADGEFNIDFGNYGRHLNQRGVYPENTRNEIPSSSLERGYHRDSSNQRSTSSNAPGPSSAPRPGNSEEASVEFSETGAGDESAKKDNSGSDSDIDIYSDIETVSTSKVEEKVQSPVPEQPQQHESDEDNDSETDMVIDTEKQQEETTVTSTVDSNCDGTVNPAPVCSSTEIQSQAIQSSNLAQNDDDEDSEDECPNFSIYSKESIIMAKHTDISDAPKKVESTLYSDSEDESVVKRGVENSFGFSDIRNMTEDISEEERSYTPCLDERGSRHGIEGLDTEMISDEDRNDFDESHDLKTTSEGDALEINAKESELDFTRPEDYEEGEIVDKSKKLDDKEPPKQEVKEEKKEVEKIESKDTSFKKLSKNNKERNYRERSKSREKKDKERDSSRKDKRKQKRKEIERYDVRALIAEKPRRLKDKFGRDVRRSDSRSTTTSTRSRSRSKSRKKKRQVSASRSKSRSRSRAKKRRRSPRKKSRERSTKTKKRSRSPKEWRRRSWTPSASRSRTPEGRRLTPSWTPPRLVDKQPRNLTVILTNDAKKKKDKKKKVEKKKPEPEVKKKKRRVERTPPPSKEVFASGDNILVSVSFNKDSDTRDVSTTAKKPRREEEPKKVRKEKPKRGKKKVKDLTGVKPVAIIDLERSPFKELTPSPKDVIILSDSENEENAKKNNVCDSSQQVASPENYLTGPKTPPEPQIKFTLASKQTQMRAISNPLHDPDDIEPEPEEHKGPNTPPEPPNSPPSSPDAYDPFEPTKSRSATPEPTQAVSEAPGAESSPVKVEQSTTASPALEVASKSHTPPLADIQPADSQSSVQASPESSVGKSPPDQAPSQPPTPCVAVASVITSTPAAVAGPPRINILNSTIITPRSTPTTLKVSPVKAKRKSNGRAQNGAGDSAEGNLGLDSPYSPGSSDYEGLFEPPVETAPQAQKPVKAAPKKSPAKPQNSFDALFGTSPYNKTKAKPLKRVVKKPAEAPGKGTKQVGVTIDEDNLKILDDLPNSAVEMQVKDKFLKKLNRQERVVEEVKLVLKPHYNKKHVTKEEYKDILRRAVPKICHNKTGEINPTKIKNLIEAYVKKVRHNKKVTSSSGSNLQKT